MILNSSMYDPDNPHEEITIQQSPIPCTGNQEVLLIQNNIPWFAHPAQDPLGAVVTELKAQNKNFCMITSTEISTTDFSSFREVIIPSAQNQQFYDDLFPGGIIHPNIENFVNDGGILSANLADFASGPGNNGNWAGRTFIGGVQHVSTNSDNLTITTPAHPIISGSAPCPSGNCGTIVDQGLRNDIDGWDFSSHGFFINLPPNTTVILTDEFGNPVTVEYFLGRGRVIATMTTTEFWYTGSFGTLQPNKKLLANDIAYQDSITVTVIDIEPPTILMCPTNITVPCDPCIGGAIVHYPSPRVQDNFPGVTVSCTPKSGSLFPVGSWAVTCTATDAAGNTATRTFCVRVLPRCD